MDQVAQFRYSVFLLAEFDQCQAFLQLGGSDFGPAGKILQDLIVALRRLLIVCLAILNFAEVEITISGEIGVGICLLYTSGKGDGAC